MINQAGLISDAIISPTIHKLPDRTNANAIALGVRARVGAGGGTGDAILGGLMGAAGEAISQGKQNLDRERQREDDLWTAEQNLKLEMKKRALLLQEKMALVEQEARFKESEGAEKERGKAEKTRKYASFAKVYADRPDLVQEAIEAAREVGISPTRLLAHWGQESNFSTDENKQGMTELSRERGRAQGPFQIVPAHHPEWRPGMTFKEQALLSASIIKRDGTDGYYGKGKAPKGHPTTEEYVAQVEALDTQIAEVLGKHPQGFASTSKGKKGLMEDPEDAMFDTSGIEIPDDPKEAAQMWKKVAGDLRKPIDQVFDAFANPMSTKVADLGYTADDANLLRQAQASGMTVWQLKLMAAKLGGVDGLLAELKDSFSADAEEPAQESGPSIWQRVKGLIPGSGETSAPAAPARAPLEVKPTVVPQNKPWQERFAQLKARRDQGDPRFANMSDQQLEAKAKGIATDAPVTGGTF